MMMEHKMNELIAVKAKEAIKNKQAFTPDDELRSAKKRAQMTIDYVDAELTRRVVQGIKFKGKEMVDNFGYTDPRDIELAQRTSRTSKTGLPYGESPSQKDMWAAAQRKRDQPALIGIAIMLGLGLLTVISAFISSFFIYK